MTEKQRRELPAHQRVAMEKDKTISGVNRRQIREVQLGTGLVSIKDVVEFVYGTVDYVSKISGDIDPTNTKL